jgi:hypothetical protein
LFPQGSRSLPLLPGSFQAISVSINTCGWISSLSGHQPLMKPANIHLIDESMPDKAL